MEQKKEQFEALVQNFNKIQEGYANLPAPQAYNDQLIHQFYQLTIKDLSTVLSNNNQSLDSVVPKLQASLAKYRQLTKHNLLSPTALPLSDITLLICQIAVFACGDKKPIEMIFEGIRWESIKAPYPDLDESIPLEQIIKTHILSDDGTTLIPVQCITEDNFIYDMHVKDMHNKTHYNPYDDSYVKEITANEARRLIEHSQLTEQAYNAFGRYHEAAKNNAKDLYSQLNRLCRLLRIEDAHTGRGTQEKVGEGAFSAIAQFGIFYDQLSKKQKQLIPADVIKAINALSDVSSNYKGDMVERIESCTGTRKEEIEKAIKGKEEALSKISLEPALVEKQKQEALALGESLIKDLKQQLQENTYVNGHEKLGFNRDLLKQLNIEFHVTDARSLELFKKLSATEMEELLSDAPGIQKEIVNTIGSLENLILITHEFTPEKMERFLAILRTGLKGKYVTSQEDYLALIITHDKEEALYILDYYFGDQYQLNRNILDDQQYKLLKEWRKLKSKFIKEVEKETNHRNYDNVQNILENITNEFLKKYAYGVYISDADFLNTETLSQFYKAGVHPCTKDKFGNTIFKRAAKMKWKIESYLDLIKISTETNRLTSDDWTRALTDYLNSALPTDNKVIQKFFVAGANPAARNRNGTTIILCASLKTWTPEQHLEFVESLKENKILDEANLNILFSEYISHANRINATTIKKYLDAGAHPLTKDTNNHSIFYRGAEKGWGEDTILEIIQHTVNTKKLTADEYTQMLTDYLAGSAGKKIKPSIILALHTAKETAPASERKPIQYADASMQTEPETTNKIAHKHPKNSTNKANEIEATINAVTTENHHHIRCNRYIQLLKEKAIDFHERGNCEQALTVLEVLIKNLEHELIQPLHEDGELSLEWVIHCLHHIKEARPKLEAHRGEHKIIMETLNIIAKFCSLLVSIITLGTVPYACGKNPFRLFPYFETDTCKQLNEFEEYLQLELK